MAETGFKVAWEGLDQLIAGVNALPREMAAALEEVQEEDLRDVASLLASYPPERIGQHYKRTGNLGFNWLAARVKTLRGTGLDFEKSLSNTTPYAGEVQGSPGQLREFKERGWKTPDQALKETEGRAQKRLDAAVQKVLNKNIKGK